MKMMANVKIEIKDGPTDGKPPNKVNHFGRGYGRYAPCNNEEEIQDAIEYAKKDIRDHGDTPVVIDKRKKAQLTNWF